MDNEGDDDDYSVENEEEEAVPPTPGRAARHHISKQSKPDYTCYTIRDGINQVIAVLIEEKLTGHSCYNLSIPAGFTLQSGFPVCTYCTAALSQLFIACVL